MIANTLPKRMIQQISQRSQTFGHAVGPAADVEDANLQVVTAGLAQEPVAVDPLQYPGWDSLLAANPDGSFFHGTAWARVLHETYKHRPVYFAKIADGRLHGLLAVMEVSSPWTGRRGVSLPFTDLCTFLQIGDADRTAFYRVAMEHGRKRGWKYLECRTNDSRWPGSSPSLSFWDHIINLGCGPKALFNGLEGAVRRGIRKAEATQLQIHISNNPEAIQSFYSLHCRTRRRHGVPPQPFRFFENIGRHILGPGHGIVSMACLGEKPVAASVFFQFGRNAIYKFGASDYSFQQLRPNNLVMWHTMKYYAERGVTQLHLGRTSLGNEGLRRFKLGFGAREEKVNYYRYDFNRCHFVTTVDQADGWINNIFRRFPPPLFRLAGQILYPHLS